MVDLRGGRKRRSDELRDAGRRDGRHRQGAKLVGRRGEILLRVPGHVPGDLLAGVGGPPAHDGQQRALGQRLAVVHRLAVADALE
ncbi:MAG: hypothetical protein ACK55I_26565, partial [bacterium]